MPNPNLEKKITLKVQADTSAFKSTLDATVKKSEDKKVEIPIEADISPIAEAFEKVLKSVDKISASFNGELRQINKDAKKIKFKSVEESLLSIETHLSNLREDIKSIDLSKIDFSNIDLSGIDKLSTGLESINEKLVEISSKIFNNARPENVIEQELKDVNEQLNKIKSNEIEVANARKILEKNAKSIGRSLLRDEEISNLNAFKKSLKEYIELGGAISEINLSYGTTDIDGNQIQRSQSLLDLLKELKDERNINLNFAEKSLPTVVELTNKVRDLENELQIAQKSSDAIKVEIDNESIQSLADAISSLKVVFENNVSDGLKETGNEIDGLTDKLKEFYENYSRMELSATSARQDYKGWTDNSFNAIHKNDFRNGKTTQTGLKRKLDDYLDINGRTSFETLAYYTTKLNDLSKAAEIFGEKNAELFEKVKQRISSSGDTISKEAQEAQQKVVSIFKEMNLGDDLSPHSLKNLIDKNGIEATISLLREENKLVNQVEDSSDNRTIGINPEDIERITQAFEELKGVLVEIKDLLKNLDFDKWVKETVKAHSEKNVFTEVEEDVDELESKVRSFAQNEDLTKWLIEIQQGINNHPIELSIELDKASLQSQLESIAPEIADAWNKKYGTILTGSDVVKAYNNVQRAAEQARKAEEKALNRKANKSANLETNVQLQSDALDKLFSKIEEYDGLASKFSERFKEIRTNLAEVGDENGLKYVKHQISELSKEINLETNAIKKNNIEQERSAKKLADTKKREAEAQNKVKQKKVDEEVIKSYEEEEKILRRIYSLRNENANLHTGENKRIENERIISNLLKQQIAIQAERTKKSLENADAEERLKNVVKQLNVSLNETTRGSIVKDMDKQLSAIDSTLKRPKLLSSYKDQLKELKNQILELGKLAPTMDTKDLVNSWNNVREAVDKAIGERAFRENQEAAKSSLEKLRKSIADIMEKNSAMGKDFENRFKNLEIRIDTAKSNADVEELKAEIVSLETAVIKAGKSGKSFFDSLGNRIKQMSTNFIAMYFSLYDIVRYLKTMVNTVKELDYSLVDLRKTTSMNNEQLNEFYMNSANIAKQLGVTSKEIIDQASSWSRLGYSTQEAATEMAALSSKFATISPGMSTETAQEGLVSIMKAYGVEVENVERSIMDNINTLGNKFALSNEDIVNGMERSAAALSATGTSLEDAFALFTGGQEILQNSEKMGTALRSISLRVRGISEETEELDDELTNINGDLINLTKTAEHSEGVSIFKPGSTTEFKSFVDYFQEIHDIWDEMSEAQQTAYLNKAFAKTQAQAGAAIITNIDQVKKALLEMQNAEGSAANEMSIASDSITFKLNALQETWTNTLIHLVDRGILSKDIDLLIEFSEALGFIIEKLGVLGSLSVGIGGFALFKNLDSIVNTLKTLNTLGNIKKIGFIDSLEKASQAADALRGLNEAQKIAIVSTLKLDKAQASNVLTMAGVKAETVETAVANGELTVAETAATETTWSLSAAFEGLATSLGVSTVALGAFLAVAAGVAVAVVAWSKYNEQIRESATEASKSADAIRDEQKALDGEIAKYKELKEKLQDANLTEDEQYEIKKQLYELQKNLNETYGDEAGKLDLVNGGYETQLELLRQISQEKAQQYKQEHESEYQEASKRLNRVNSYGLDFSENGLDPRLFNILNNYKGLTNLDQTNPVPEYRINLNSDDAIDVLRGLYDRVEQFGEDTGAEVSNELSVIAATLNSITTDELYVADKNVVQEYTKQAVLADNELRKIYSNGLDAVEQYNDALLKYNSNADDESKAQAQKTISETKKNLLDVQNEFNKFKDNVSGSEEVFDSLWDKINTGAEKTLLIEERLSDKTTHAYELAEKLKGINDFELEDIDFNSKNLNSKQQAFVDLANSLGLPQEETGELINKLVELDFAIGSTTNEIKESEEALSTWDLDSELGKIDVTRDDFDKYLHTMLELNPALNANTEEAEKAALANLQFSKALEDLDSNFETYKATLEDNNKLTPEYATAIQGLSKDLTYLTGIDFSQAEADKFLDKENLELLEKAIQGDDEALQSLQKHAREDIEIQINYDELNKFAKTANNLIEDELKELGKGGNVDLTLRPQIETSVLKEAGYEIEDAAEDYATVFTHTFTNKTKDIAVNFTPIIVDPNTGEYKGVMEQGAFERYCEDVIAGVRQDDLNLQIGAKFTGEDAVAQAEAAAERIHSLHELQLELGLSTDEFNTQFTDFLNWLNTADLGTLEAQTYLNESPFLQGMLDLVNQGKMRAEELKALFASLGWDIKWDEIPMRVPMDTPNRSYTSIPTSAKNDMKKQGTASKYLNDVKGGGISWRMESVPTNIRFERNGGSRNTSTSKYTPSSASSPSSRGSSGKSSGGGGGGGSSKDPTDEAKKDEEELEDTYDEFFDYFERRLKVISDAISLLDANLENVVGSKAKNSLLDAQMRLYKMQQQEYSDARDMYQEMADKALEKIPDNLREDVKNGAVAIDEFIGKEQEDVINAINDYTKWADKIAECKQQLAELKEQIRQLELNKMKNILQDWQDVFDLRQNSAIDLIDKQIALIEQTGEAVGDAFYKQQKSQSEKQLQALQKAKDELVAEFNRGLANGSIEKGSSEWIEEVSLITQVEQSILDCKKAIDEFDNAILQIHTDVFERVQAKFDDFDDQLSDIASFIEDIDVGNKYGEWSKEGIARAGMLAQQYEMAQKRVADYSSEIAWLNQQYKLGKFSTLEYTEKLADLMSAQRDAAQDAKDYKDAIIDLNRARIDIEIDAIEKDIDAYNELIQKQKDALTAEKD